MVTPRRIGELLIDMGLERHRGIEWWRPEDRWTDPLKDPVLCCYPRGPGLFRFLIGRCELTFARADIKRTYYQDLFAFVWDATHDVCREQFYHWPLFCTRNSNYPMYAWTLAADAIDSKRRSRPLPPFCGSPS
jgi:hypothetical protein